MKTFSIQTKLDSPWVSSRRNEPSILALRTAARSEGGGQHRWRVFLALSPRHSRLELHLPLGSSDLLILTLPLLLLAYAAYFLAACILDFQRALALFVLTCLVLLVLVHRALKSLFGKTLTRCLKPFENSCLKLWMKRWVKNLNISGHSNLSPFLLWHFLSCFSDPHLYFSKSTLRKQITTGLWALDFHPVSCSLMCQHCQGGRKG